MKGQFDDAIRAYRAAFPADPGIDVNLLDYYTLRRQFDDLLSCSDRLDQAVGGDPLLDGYRMSVYLQKGDLATAKKCAQNAAAANPEWPLARDGLNAISQMEKYAPADRPIGSSELSEASPGQPAGDAEAKAFADAFEKTVMSSDSAAVRAAFDFPAFHRRAMAKLDIPEEARVGIEIAVGLDTSVAAVFTAVQSQVEQGADFRLLRIHRVGKEQRALFRCVHPNGTVSYLDCILVRHADGKVRIDDVYLFEEAEMLSETLSRLLSLANEYSTKKYQSATAENDGAKLATAWSEMTNRIKAGKYQEALDISRTLPDRLQKEKLILIMRIQAARGLKGEPYDQAVREYRKAFRNEPNMDLIMIDAYYAHKLFDLVLASIDGLDRTLGGDPYLDVCALRRTFRKATLLLPSGAPKVGRNGAGFADGVPLPPHHFAQGKEVHGD